MITPKVAVITPTKNRLALLREAMSSVAGQTCGDWEHIIVDDGSEDATPEEVARRAAEDPRIRLIRRRGEKGGANVCRNIGVGESRSDYIVFLDSDDLLEPECLRQRVEVMERNLDVDFATFQTSVFRETPGDLGRQLDPELIGDDLLRFLFFEAPWIITGPIWRKAALERLGLLDEELPSWQDIELHIRAITAGCRYLRFPEVDHHVRWQFELTKVSVEQRRSPRHLEAALRTLEKFERCVVEGPGLDWVRQRALCSLYFFVAEQWAAKGNLGAALRTWRRIRDRSLGPRGLYLTGAGLLAILASGSTNGVLPGRLTNKWKGWMRMRTNPDLLVK